MADDRPDAAQHPSGTGRTSGAVHDSATRNPAGRGPAGHDPSPDTPAADGPAPPGPAALAARIAEVSLADASRLRRALSRARRLSGAAQRRELAKLAERVATAERRIAVRKAAIPQIRYPRELPVSTRVADLAAAIRQHQVVIVAGETGSGKSTQLPKICLQLGRGVKGLIGHTQPRRIAARTLAERIAAETETIVGEAIGYTIRFGDHTGPRTAVKLMTDGILLAEIAADPDLMRYDTLIIDEAHERSLNVDFLLGYIHRLLPRRPDLKVIITSATIDPEKFARHFGGAPVVEVSGRTYPVEIRYRPYGLEADSEDDAADLVEDGDGPEGIVIKSNDDPRDFSRSAAAEVDQIGAILAAVDELLPEGDGDILVFLSGEREITDTADALAGHLRAKGAWAQAIEVLPLYGRLSMADQHKVFAPRGRRRIVLATNVAETSLTVPGIRYVIDPGTARISRYSARTKVQRLPIEKVSQASAGQRAGRCGRVADGICIRLYSEGDFESRPVYTDPEIARTSLAAVLLQMAALGLGEVATFPFLDPPDAKQVADGLAVLGELGALERGDAGSSRGSGSSGDPGRSSGDPGRSSGDPGRSSGDPGRSGRSGGSGMRLTAVGRQLARLPVDPRLARILVEGDRRGCLAEMLIVVAALAIRDVREYPLDDRERATAWHSRFADPSSDFVSLVNLWYYLARQAKTLSGNRFRKMCVAEYLHYLRIREWQDLHAQLSSAAGALGMAVGRSARVDGSGAGHGGRSRRSAGAKQRAGHTAAARGTAATDAAPAGAASASSASAGAPAAGGPVRGSEAVGVDQRAVHTALAAGLASHIGSRIERERPSAGKAGRKPAREYQGTRGTTFAIWPGSVLARTGAPFVLAAELVETSRLWARTVAAVDPAWVEEVGGDLLRRSYSDPHWSAKRQAAMASEKVMLLGVTLIPARTVPYARIDPEHARELLIRHGLVEGALLSPGLPFLDANQRALAEVAESERRARRDIAIDDDTLFALYDERIPADVTSGRALEAFWRASDSATRAALTFTPDMLVAAGAELARRDHYPDQLTADGVTIGLDYVFAPGAADDGVSATVPLAALATLDPASVPAQVPGLRRDLALALIKSLPKGLRRYLVPAPDFADAALERIGDARGGLPERLADALTALAGVPITPSDYDYGKVPDHLRMRFTVVDDSGREVATGTDLPALARELRPDTREAVAKATPTVERRGLTTFPPEGLSRQVRVSSGGVEVTGYPALADEGETVAVIVYTTAADQARAMRSGMRRLLTLALADKVTPLIARLTRFPQGPSAPGGKTSLTKGDVIRLSTAPHGSLAALVADAAEAAIDALYDWAGGAAFTAADFEARQAAIAGQLERAVTDILLGLLPVLAAAARAEEAIAAAAAPRETIAEWRAELAGYRTPHLITEYGAAHLPDLARYLTALAIRAERFAERAGRDRVWAAEYAEAASAVEDRLAELRPERRGDDDVRAVRFLLAEYRIALFAQPMRAAQPVSGKRIRAAADALPE